jgi:hypothetical protein
MVAGGIYASKLGIGEGSTATGGLCVSSRLYSITFGKTVGV